MLKIVIPETEYYDEGTNQFVTVKEQTLMLEHSLVSISKWESKWHKPFLHQGEDFSEEEALDYFRCMTITQNVNPLVYHALTPTNILEIKEYIDNPMTATTIKKLPGGGGKHANRIITSEVIYYWMVSHQIPSEYEKWHLARLLTLIQVCNIENGPKKNMSKKDIYAQNKALNEARRKRFGSSG